MPIKRSVCQRRRYTGTPSCYWEAGEGRRRVSWQSQPLFVPGSPTRPPVRLCAPSGLSRHAQAGMRQVTLSDTAEPRQASPSPGRRYLRGILGFVIH